MRTILNRYVCTAAAAVLLVGSAHANIIYTGGTSDTVYGVTSYGAPVPGAPTFIFNNLTGLNDILSSPGGTYLTADPSVGNNVAELAAGLVPDPNFFAWTGGSNGNGTFGSGLTVDTGNTIGFALSDTTAGCCAASYMITSTDSTFAVVGGFNGTLGAYLGISGFNPTINDSSVASLEVEYNIDNLGWIAMPDMILAAGGACNDVALGGSGAFVGGGCVGGSFQGLSVDNLGLFNLVNGDTIEVISTLTAYTDPASIGSIVPDSSLVSETGASLPDFSLTDTTTTPEPATVAVVGIGLLFAALSMKRRRVSR